MFILLDIGCAECLSGAEPLIERFLHFDTLEWAKLSVPGYKFGDWKVHPLGGEYLSVGDGEYWVVPVSLFTKEK